MKWKRPLKNVKQGVSFIPRFWTNFAYATLNDKLTHTNRLNNKCVLNTYSRILFRYIPSTIQQLNYMNECRYMMTCVSCMSNNDTVNSLDSILKICFKFQIEMMRNNLKKYYLNLFTKFNFKFYMTIVKYVRNYKVLLDTFRLNNVNNLNVWYNHTKHKGDRTNLFK